VSKAIVKGDRFVRLVVIRMEATTRGRRRWRCLCDCGKTKVASTRDLTTGRTKSCGCLKREAETIQLAPMPFLPFWPFAA